MPRKKKPDKPSRRRWGEGSITLRADGRWEARAPRDPAGQRVATYHATRADAERWHTERLQPRTPGLGDGDTPFGPYLIAWYRAREPSLANQTRGGYLQAIECARPLFAVPVKDLRVDHFAALFAELARTGKVRSDGVCAPLAPRTIEQRRRVLTMALKDIVPRLLSENPVAKTRLPRRQRDAPDVWNRQEIAAFLAAAERLGSRLVLLYRLTLAIGARVGELRGLQWQDVDWERGELIIQRSLETAGPAGPTKTAEARRVPLLPELLDELQTERARFRGPRRWLLTLDADRPVGSTTIRKDYQRVKAAAKLRHITFHDLRHCAASLMLSDGVPVPEVAAILGHADPSMTLRVYSHWIRDDRSKSQASMRKTLFGTSKRENGHRMEVNPGDTEMENAR